MYNASINVSLECPVHPEFKPEEAIPTKRCRCCNGISNVYDWIRMAQRTAARIAAGGYPGMIEPEVLGPSVEEIADIAGVTSERSTGPGNESKKRAQSTMILKAPESLGKVRRKL